MLTTTEVKVDKDLKSKKMTFTKHFNAKPDVVWNAWTKKEILDQWWAPKPWRAETNKFDFQNGGSWQYAMIGPNDEKHYGKFQYTSIHALKSFEGSDSFTDEKGFINVELPQSNWKVEFRSAGAGTDVKATITPKTDDALEKILAMGFEDGFKMGLNNLEEYLEDHHL